MGYSTDFYGSVSFNKPVSEELKNYINKFSKTRRMERDVNKIKEVFPDWAKNCFNGNLGINGEYFVGGNGFMGQEDDESVINHNCPPKTQPGLWCQWIINDNGELEWDGNEKFYNYVEWLEYLIKHFFKPEGYILNGIINFQGDESDDCGYIKVTNNIVEQVYDDGNVTIEDYSDNELIAELESRGYIVKKGA